MKKILSAFTIGALFLFSATVSYGEGNLAKQKPIELIIEMNETKEGRMIFKPDNIVFETGKLYKVRLQNKGKIKHEIESELISNAAYTRKIQILDGNKNGALVAEVKSSGIKEIEVGPGYEVEWWFVPIATGKAQFVCALPGHLEAGMYGNMEFK